MADEYDESCPFCNIAKAYPHSSSSEASSSLASCIPADPSSDKLSPSCFLVLSAPTVMAFLDIMPMTAGHVLVTTRPHREKVSDLSPGLGADVGSWLPLLARAVMRAVGVADYNIVQNNGARAAQVVPHVHFHIIPRPETVPELRTRSWTMFGKGQREDLDDGEAEAMARELRHALADVVREHEDALAERASSSSSKL
ncbi:MAG: HIT domain-containing protein [Terriglobus roseus]|nr:HIT domain-containing protein [Terriglobus roseus]